MKTYTFSLLFYVCYIISGITPCATKWIFHSEEKWKVVIRSSFHFTGLRAFFSLSTLAIWHQYHRFSLQESILQITSEFWTHIIVNNVTGETLTFEGLLIVNQLLEWLKNIVLLKSYDHSHDVWKYKYEQSRTRKFYSLFCFILLILCGLVRVWIHFWDVSLWLWLFWFVLHSKLMQALLHTNKWHSWYKNWYMHTYDHIKTLVLKIKTA